MKIQVKGEGNNITILLPTNLVFSKATAWLANYFGHKHAADAMRAIPPEALPTLFAEIRRMKKRYKRYELVDVVTSDGTSVKIII